jgi:DNA repair exonuclease SbcCD nuclease subunit
VALGHYHRAVEVAPRAWYAGSTERCSFRECGETKSVNLVDLATGRVEPRPLATRPMVDLPTLSCEGVDEAAIAPALRARLAEARLEGAIARLRVTGVPAHVYATLDLERVRRATAAALHFDLQVEVSSTGGSGAAAAPLRTLDEELEAFLSARPLQGADRDELLATAREILAEAAAP